MFLPIRHSVADQVLQASSQDQRLGLFSSGLLDNNLILLFRKTMKLRVIQQTAWQQVWRRLLSQNVKDFLVNFWQWLNSDRLLLLSLDANSEAIVFWAQFVKLKHSLRWILAVAWTSFQQFHSATLYSPRKIKRILQRVRYWRRARCLENSSTICPFKVKTPVSFSSFSNNLEGTGDSQVWGHINSLCDSHLSNLLGTPYFPFHNKIF